MNTVDFISLLTRFMDNNEFISMIWIRIGFRYELSEKGQTKKLHSLSHILLIVDDAFIE